MEIEKLEIKVFELKTKFKEEVKGVKGYKEILDKVFVNDKEFRKLRVSVKVNGGYGKNKETGMTAVIDMRANKSGFWNIFRDTLEGYKEK